MKDKDRIWHLMARKFSGEATEEELKELEVWLQKHPEMTYSLQLLADLWKARRSGFGGKGAIFPG